MKLIAVTNDTMQPQQLAATLLAIEPYIDAVIVREKTKVDATLLGLLQTILARGFDSEKIIVHGRVDIATVANIQKVQLPSHGIPLTLAKEQFPHLSFGRSIHSHRGAETAVHEGADWLLYGHLFPTDSKQGLPPRGTEELYRITTSLPVPVYAIGGIQVKHIQALRKAKVAGLAVMSSIFTSDNPKEAAQAYHDAIYEREDFP